MTGALSNTKRTSHEMLLVAVRKAIATGLIMTLPDGTIGGKLAAELREMPTRWRVVPFLTRT